MRWSSRFRPVLFPVVVLLAVTLPGIGQVAWREHAVAVEPAGLPAGPVWLRSWLKVPDNMVDPAGSDLWRDSMTLTLQHLPGEVSVLLNGVEIIKTVDLLDEPRRFKVPKGILKKAAWNANAQARSSYGARSRHFFRRERPRLSPCPERAALDAQPCSWSCPQ